MRYVSEAVWGIRLDLEPTFELFCNWSSSRDNNISCLNPSTLIPLSDFVAYKLLVYNQDRRMTQSPALVLRNGCPF
jgi:hypothetical protein